MENENKNKDDETMIMKKRQAGRARQAAIHWRFSANSDWVV